MSWAAVVERVFTQKRKATQAELELACKKMHLDPSQVAEAWVDDTGSMELVMRGFIDKVQVTTKIGEGR